MYSLTRRETERVNLLLSARRAILNDLEPSEKMVSGSVAAPPAVDSRSCWTATLREERAGLALSLFGVTLNKGLPA